ncbi:MULTISPECIES: response regulator [Idiomarinaceae]|uniref:Two-component system chemotaxis response regulator CheY n=2 Tax=Pseudidiomarina TaxID=2800384 RepID=A0A368V580_9GAMM|nr:MULTISPECIES: response regulator [Idiomarinaceae]MRJ42348.1 response regulator [Idiomarina sp. FeN1]NCU57473.1 response regulator [Idiomarina sp. FenA--70]NCU60660.1 response regulator [Idiomarina sp. FenBw--71]PWW15967.1 two-component system chemotaxis response regulator CheY [Pseudidiomarina maritima]RBP93523.1 two-component system chemotaxis response regulator CheY [Pseudidiomarina tainanensis]
MSLKLLLVEDKPATQAQLLQILVQSQFSVSCANDGLDGLNRVKNKHFDVILVDHKMPLMDGMALIKNIRQLPAYKQTPVILMTTQDVNQVAGLAEKAGANLCLAKPIAADRLLGLLQDLASTIHNPKQLTV